MLRQPNALQFPDPQLALIVRRDLIPDRLCRAMIERIDAHRRPSTIAGTTGDHTFRTSETCDLDPSDPAVAEVEQLLYGFSGLDPRHGEPLQGQRYAVGQQFKAHTDYFEPDSEQFAKFCSHAGNRTWTVMAYLNDVATGGDTWFTAIDLSIRAEAGKVLAWSNLQADGRPNPATIHHGMKVQAGTKYILTKWFRQRPWG